MAACQVLYYDPRLVGRAILGPPGRRDHLIGRHDGWRPCPAEARRHREVAGHLRDVCPDHERQLRALAAADLADHVRWARRPAG